MKRKLRKSFCPFLSLCFTPFLHFCLTHIPLHVSVSLSVCLTRPFCVWMCETESLFVFLCLSCFVNSLFFSHFHTRIKRRIVQLQLTRRKVKDGIREDFRKQPLTCDAQTQWSQKPPFWSKHPIYSSKCLGCRWWRDKTREEDDSVVLWLQQWRVSLHGWNHTVGPQHI